MKEKLVIFWFRRDLRLTDNAGLYAALSSGKKVLPLFIFDTEILVRLEDKYDKRVDFIHQVVASLKTNLNNLGSDIIIRLGSPQEVFAKLLEEFAIDQVYTNQDYEPYALQRDRSIKDFLETQGVSFHSYKDQVVFEKSDVLKDDGSPYTVFTPYSKKWKARLTENDLLTFHCEQYYAQFCSIKPVAMLPLDEIGFKKTDISYQLPEYDEALISQYAAQRDYPAIKGTSRLSVHLRFGTLSIRALVLTALRLNETWLNELIWREFYMCILFHFPHVVEGAFKPQYEAIQWRNNETEFEAWCQGETGYPIVDAGMRELNSTGFMHNRVRMIVASFLTKHLLIDWRWGEAYFAAKLLDFDLAANNGGWQWAAGSGCDAAPYFRIFNPYEQTKKFDKDLRYTRKWVPEFEEFTYPKPIVDHKFARERVLRVYKQALK